jgi:hypothetical protein
MEALTLVALVSSRWQIATHRVQVDTIKEAAAKKCPWHWTDFSRLNPKILDNKGQ